MTEVFALLSTQLYYSFTCAGNVAVDQETSARPGNRFPTNFEEKQAVGDSSIIGHVTLDLV